MIAHDNRGEIKMAFAAKEQGRVIERGACKICGRYAHEETNCYEVIGHLSHWGAHGRGPGSHGG